MPIDCDKCDGLMFRVYTNEKVEYLVNKSSLTDPINRMKYTVLLRNQWVCKECKYYKELSMKEYLTLFYKQEKEKGKSMNDMVKEVKEVKKNAEKEFSRLNK